MNHKLEIDSVQLSFGQRRILTDVYLSCHTGAITALLGRNGEGKTCLMNILYGSLKGENQSVRFDNTFTEFSYKRTDLLLYLPQFRFIPKALKIKRVFSDYGLCLDTFKLHFPEFNNLEEERIGNLSGGQSRIIEVYIIVKSPAQFIILDEPFSHIMPLHLASLKEIIRKEKERKGFLISDHLYRDVLDIADTIYVLKDGKTYRTKSHDDVVTLGYIRSL